MTARSEFSSAADFIYQSFGDEAVYTDRDGNTEKVEAILRDDLSRFGEIAEIAQSTATISVRRCELPEVPRRGETFEIDGVSYLVGDLVDADEIEHTVLVVAQ